MRTEIEILEKEIIDFTNDLFKSNEDIFKELDIVIKEYPRIVVWETIREFAFSLWTNKRKDILIVVFPTLVLGKPFYFAGSRVDKE